MNQHKLQQKRRKRQASRKAAQVTARRRGQEEKAARDRMIAKMRADILKPKPMRQGLLERFFNGTAVTGDQMDREAAPIVGGAP